MRDTDSVKIRRSAEFTAISHKVGGHLNALPLDSEQHNRLVALIAEQVIEAESTAFLQGVELGVRMGRECSSTHIS
ncbi:hypothetical protein LJC63_01545 [Ruminococcaceae bacterium OttesenSCG-928-L11]|nr:hypothetical protein [Ruminococcaceae bacterium OttesenSCG-928-L11]